MPNLLLPWPWKLKAGMISVDSGIVISITMTATRTPLPFRPAWSLSVSALVHLTPRGRLSWKASSDHSARWLPDDIGSRNRVFRVFVNYNERLRSRSALNIVIKTLMNSAEEGKWGILAGTGPKARAAGAALQQEWGWWEWSHVLGDGKQVGVDNFCLYVVWWIMFERCSLLRRSALSNEKDQEDAVDLVPRSAAVYVLIQDASICPKPRSTSTFAFKY